jgi:hypothetical protein
MFLNTTPQLRQFQNEMSQLQWEMNEVVGERGVWQCRVCEVRMRAGDVGVSVMQSTAVMWCVSECDVICASVSTRCG